MNASMRREQDKAATPAKSSRGPKCPICGKATSHDYRPFCGRTCADIDLGCWLAGRYAVPGEPVRDIAEIEDGD